MQIIWEWETSLVLWMVMVMGMVIVPVRVRAHTLYLFIYVSDFASKNKCYSLYLSHSTYYRVCQLSHHSHFHHKGE